MSIFVTKYVIGALGVAILGIATFYFAFNRDDTSKVRVGSAIVVAESFYDFGDIDIFGGKVRTMYTLQNTGQEDVVILSAVTSCMCTEGEIDGLQFGMHRSSGKTGIIPAGEERMLTAIFDPLAHGPNGTGKVKREMSLTMNSTVTPEIKVTFAANVVKSETE